MRIGFIARGLTKGGVTRYIKNILDIFNKECSNNYSFVIFTDDKSFKSVYQNLTIIYIQPTIKLWWDYFKILPFLLKYRTDVIIYPKNIIPFTHLLFDFKKINVVHDLAYFDKELNEYKTSDTLYMKLFMKFSCKIADQIIAVSKSTKESIIKILKISSHKIHVIHEGVELKFKKETNKIYIQQTLLKYNISQPFIFYCGSLSPRKNILTSLKAFNKIKDLIPHNIYIAGGQSWHDEDVKIYIKKNVSERVKTIGYITDNELIHIYSSADLYLYPSVYEGFGLPILEAQACGCPVLISDRTSCPEVAGQGAIIIEPYNINDIANKIVKILKDINFRNEMILKGLENSKKYNWEDTAYKIIKLISRYEK